jgi:hypothetical protein
MPSSGMLRHVALSMSSLHIDENYVRSEVSGLVSGLCSGDVMRLL